MRTITYGICINGMVPIRVREEEYFFLPWNNIFLLPSLGFTGGAITTAKSFFLSHFVPITEMSCLSPLYTLRWLWQRTVSVESVTG